MHNTYHSIERVAKGGGTTLAQPQRFAEQLNHPNNHAEIAVVSAAGKNPGLGLDIKLTDLLIRHERRGEWPRNTLAGITGHVAVIGALMDPHGRNQIIQHVVGNVDSDISDWQRRGYPLAGLGEKWTAKMFAAYTDRELVDATELVSFTAQGLLDPVTTRKRIRRRLGHLGNDIVVPGFYGSDQHGHIHTLSRGGSDVSAALIAEALDAESYHNWSDVPGFLTADPRIVATAQHIESITRREVNEMSFGCELLHPDAIRYSGDITPIHMRHTFGEPTDPGTAILPTREWSDMPVVGVVSQRATVPSREPACLPESSAAKQSTHQLMALRIVGEGLAASSDFRDDIRHRIVRLLADRAIPEISHADTPNTPSITCFIKPSLDSSETLNAVHDTVFERTASELLR